MTSKFSIDNRELLQRISSGEAVVGIDFGNLIVRELAAFRMVAMDSEPDCKERKLFCSTDTTRMRKTISVSAGTEDAPLYRHAQQPVVSADLLHTAASAIEDLLTTKDRTGAGVWFDLPFRLRSAANAQPAPVVPDAAAVYAQLSDHEKWSTSLENVNHVLNACRSAMLAAAPQSPGSEPATVPGKWIPVSEQKPDCWCLTCRPVTLNDMRFVVCPDCGNKRCPRANDHRNACTGSNEPGQEGSAYPDTPQEVNHD